MSEKIKTTLRDMATADGRTYITPEDVENVMNGRTVLWSDIVKEFLYILSNQGSYGLEDKALCAYELIKDMH